MFSAELILCSRLSCPAAAVSAAAGRAGFDQRQVALFDFFQRLAVTVDVFDTDLVQNDLLSSES